MGAANEHLHPAGFGSSQEPVRITSEKDRDITDYFWKGPNRVVYLKDVGGDENDHVVVVDRRSGEPRDVTPFPGVKAQLIDALVEFPNRPKRVPAVSARVSGGRREDHAGDRAAAVARQQVEAAAMETRDPIDDRKAEARACGAVGACT